MDNDTISGRFHASTDDTEHIGLLARVPASCSNTALPEEVCNVGNHSCGCKRDRQHLTFNFSQVSGSYGVLENQLSLSPTGGDVCLSCGCYNLFEIVCLLPLSWMDN
jgi:hypothetical protein